MRRYENIFPHDLSTGVSSKRPYDHTIKLESVAHPTVLSQWSLSEPNLQGLQAQLYYTMEKKFIRPSTSPYAALITFNTKNIGGNWMCTDYLALNNITIEPNIAI
ncbi:hypothetical protein CLOM_g22558 [Closterium sp. NIES-68]|nr:hypothetical protein CLOM_g22558 [Closterium sp. NIES-68]